MQDRYVYMLKEFAIDERGGIYANLKMQKSFLCYIQKKSNGGLLITVAASQPSRSPAPPHGPRPQSPRYPSGFHSHAIAAAGHCSLSA